MSDINSLLSARDEWDCLIQYLRQKLGRGKLEPLRVEVLANSKHQERWVDGWLTGHAAVTEGDPFRLPKEETIEWARKTGHFVPAEYDAHRAKFFRRADNLPEFDFAFVGRARELEELKTTLNQHSKASITTALRGLGGQGKSALAFEYARGSRTEFAATIWLNGGADIEAQLASFARERGSAELDADKKGQARILDICEKLALAFRGRILLVLDDVPTETPQIQISTRASSTIKSLLALPKHLGARFRMLFTSRAELELLRDHTMFIERLTRQDAVALFLSRAHFSREKLDLTGLEHLADTVLGGHALSISLLATYARQNKIRDFAELERLLQGRIVDAEQMRGALLDEYPRELYGTFRLAFDALSGDARLLLLWLSMFQREVIDLSTVKRAAHEMEPETREVSALSGRLARAGGPATSARELVRFALVEQVGANPRSRVEVRKIQLHEVIYDFARAEWARLSTDESASSILRDLELSVTRGAIAFISRQLEAGSAVFQDIAALSGLLVPEVQVARGLVPDAERVRESLLFWYDHFIYQNFVYDTGLQEALLPRIVALRDYLESTSQLPERFELVLSKLIGHGYYGNPSESGHIAEQAFTRALGVAQSLDEAQSGDEGQIATARWYRVFLLDHRSNIASKKRGAKHAEPIRNDPQFVSDFDEIERVLPASLRDLEGSPSEEECELLLRAAHYWGHRGNQDGWIQLQRFLAGSLEPGTDAATRSARENYIRAANYRMIALRVFRNGQFKRYLGRPLTRLPFVVEWLDSCPTLTASRRYESFTTIAQGIGDLAHQYRGLFVVVALDLLAGKPGAQPSLLEEATQILRAAETLWNIASITRMPDEAPLRYQLSMNSCEVISLLLENHYRESAPTPLVDLLQRVRNANARMQAEMRTSYHFMAEEQLRQVEAIWNYLSNQK
ncbi:MAG: hypothetical protein WDO69_33565 [Pseudomonadota bacterium]